MPARGSEQHDSGSCPRAWARAWTKSRPPVDAPVGVVEPEGLGAEYVRRAVVRPERDAVVGRPAGGTSVVLVGAVRVALRCRGERHAVPSAGAGCRVGVGDVVQAVLASSSRNGAMVRNVICSVALCVIFRNKSSETCSFYKKYFQRNAESSQRRNRPRAATSRRPLRRVEAGRVQKRPVDDENSAVRGIVLDIFYYFLTFVPYFRVSVPRIITTQNANPEDR